MTPWLIWLVCAIVLLIIEVLSGTVAALCLALGCVLAIIPAVIGADAIVTQFIVACVGAVGSFIILAPVIRRYKLNKPDHRDQRSNMDAIIGRTGIVTEPIYPDGRQGRVKVDGDNWLAVTDACYCPVLKGETVEVLSYDSIVIKVRPKR
ncbi:MAG: NfeD family protein [Bacteroidales bacterium]|nr:NfeD family protein [Bacteroidales bacterium]MBD5258934.1 NfeD family protein [Barnesiella sp.]